jgi:hypothetical protein
MNGDDMAVVAFGEQIGFKQFRAFANMEGEIALRINGVTFFVNKSSGHFECGTTPTRDLLDISDVEFLRDGVVALRAELP